MDYVTLNNGVRMPILGYGTLKLPESICADCVAKAIETGWRLIDTARNYANERQVGEGIAPQRDRPQGAFRHLETMD